MLHPRALKLLTLRLKAARRHIATERERDPTNIEQRNASIASPQYKLLHESIQLVIYFRATLPSILISLRLSFSPLVQCRFHRHFVHDSRSLGRSQATSCMCICIKPPIYVYRSSIGVC